MHQASSHLRRIAALAVVVCLIAGVAVCTVGCTKKAGPTKSASGKAPDMPSAANTQPSADQKAMMQQQHGGQGGAAKGASADQKSMMMKQHGQGG